MRFAAERIQSMFARRGGSACTGQAIRTFRALPALLLIAAGAFAQAAPRFKVLAFFSASYDAAHIDFAHEANRWFPKAAAEHGFQYDSTKDWSRLSPAGLKGYQVVIFLDNQPPAAQRAGFQQWMDQGGAWFGFHVCAFNTNAAGWDWYYNQLLGCGSFKTNTWGPTSAILKVEDTTHPATSRLPGKYKTTVSEWYGWNVDLRAKPDIKILCSIDPSSFPLGTDPNQSWYSGYYPIVWTHRKYRMIYANFGHNDMDYTRNVGKSRTFDNEINNRLVIDALLWLGGQAPVGLARGTGAAGPANPGLELRREGSRLTVTRAGSGGFGLSLLSPDGRVLLLDRAATGTWSSGAVRLPRGPYLLRAESPDGAASSTFRIP